MITLTMAGQTLLTADGTAANGEIRVSPAHPFEYDETTGRTMVLVSTTTLLIKNGVLVDATGQPTTYDLAPISGAGNDVENNYYNAIWIMNGATPIAQKWDINLATNPLPLLDIQLISVPALPVVTSPGATGLTGQGIDHVTRTSGNGAAGTVDGYTLWGDAGETITVGTYQVLNGSNGSGGLLAVNNLSDVQSAPVSLANIGGLGSNSLVYGGGF